MKVRRSPLDWILVDRLKEVYWGALERSWSNARVRASVPQPAYVPHESPLRADQAWHLGRVHHFVQLLEAEKTLDPIEVDNRFDKGGWGPPFVSDGHHRFVASVLTKRRRILASCGGLTSSIEWLCGSRRRSARPLELR